MGRKQREHGRGVGEGGLVPEECAPPSERIGGATRPAEMEAQSWVIQRKRKEVGVADI